MNTPDGKHQVSYIYICMKKVHTHARVPPTAFPFNHNNRGFDWGVGLGKITRDVYVWKTVWRWLEIFVYVVFSMLFLSLYLSMGLSAEEDGEVCNWRTAPLFPTHRRLSARALLHNNNSAQLARQS